HVHGIAALALAPIGLDQALGLPLGEALQARTIVAVHRHALAARDEAADRIWRHGLAAARELREQAVQANDKHPGLRGLAFSSIDNFLFLWRWLAAKRCLHLPHVDLVYGVCD